MSYMRAGGLTTLIIAILTTVCLVWFSEWYGGFSSGEMVQRTFFWFAISLLGVTPVCLVLFPILHNIPALKYRPSGKVFVVKTFDRKNSYSFALIDASVVGK